MNVENVEVITLLVLDVLIQQHLIMMMMQLLMTDHVNMQKTIQIGMLTLETILMMLQLHLQCILKVIILVMKVTC